jgi:hypothetical protein
MGPFETRLNSGGPGVGEGGSTKPLGRPQAAEQPGGHWLDWVPPASGEWGQEPGHRAHPPPLEGGSLSPEQSQEAGRYLNSYGPHRQDNGGLEPSG